MKFSIDLVSLREVVQYFVSFLFNITFQFHVVVCKYTVGATHKRIDMYMIMLKNC